MLADSKEFQTQYWVICILSCVCLLNISPMVFSYIGGDMITRIAHGDCFAHQFWEGNLFPRWCFSGNAGMGAPFFVTYFPLSNYVLALLYPLQGLGIDDYHRIVLSIALATFVTAFGAYSWLRDFSTSKIALLATIVFLFFPYRMEVMHFRAALAEVWVIAFLPYIFKYTRRLALGERVIIPLSFVVALSILSHSSIALLIVLCSSLYMVCRTTDYKAWGEYAVSIIAAVFLSAFFLLPGVYYSAYVRTDMLSGLHAIVNSGLSLEGFSTAMSGKTVYGLLYVPAVLTAILTLVLFGYYWGKKSAVVSPDVRKEWTCWVIVSLVAFFILSPLSQPLYELLGRYANYLLPWRVQSVLALYMTWFFAMWLGHLRTPKRAVGDIAILYLFLLFMGNALNYTYTNPDAAFSVIEKYKANHIVVANEYRTVWTDDAYFSEGYFAKRIENAATTNKAEFVKGAGQVRVQRWTWQEIILDISARQGSIVRLDHYYFPAWHAYGQADDLVEVTPEQGSGQMLLHVPSGQHTIRLIYSDEAAGWWLDTGAKVLSLATFVLLLWAGLRSVQRSASDRARSTGSGR